MKINKYFSFDDIDLQFGVHAVQGQWYKILHGFWRPTRNDEIPSDTNRGGSEDQAETAKNHKILIISKTGGPRAKTTLFSDLPPSTSVTNGCSLSTHSVEFLLSPIIFPNNSGKIAPIHFKFGGHIVSYQKHTLKVYLK